MCVCVTAYTEYRRENAFLFSNDWREKLKLTIEECILVH